VCVCVCVVCLFYVCSVLSVNFLLCSMGHVACNKTDDIVYVCIYVPVISYVCDSSSSTKLTSCQFFDLHVKHLHCHSVKAS